MVINEPNNVLHKIGISIFKYNIIGQSSTYYRYWYVSSLLAIISYMGSIRLVEGNSGHI